MPGWFEKSMPLTPALSPFGGEGEKNFMHDTFHVTRSVLAHAADSLSSPKGGEGWGEGGQLFSEIENGDGRGRNMPRRSTAKAGDF